MHGGLTGGMGIRDCAKKECQEEASVDEDPLDKRSSCTVASSLHSFLAQSL